MQPQLRLQQQPQTVVAVVVLFICTLPFGLGCGDLVHMEAGQGTRCQNSIQNDMKTTTFSLVGGIGLEL